MKRRPLARTPSLSRSSGLRRRRKPPNAAEDLSARAEWKIPHYGLCECGCDPPAFSWHLERHHVFSAELIKQEGRLDLLWDWERNSMLLVPRHHSRHTNAVHRIPLSAVPQLAFEFGRELLGEDRMTLYLCRQYGHGELAA